LVPGMLSFHPSPLHKRLIFSSFFFFLIKNTSGALGFCCVFPFIFVGTNLSSHASPALCAMKHFVPYLFRLSAIFDCGIPLLRHLPSFCPGFDKKTGCVIFHLLTNRLNFPAMNSTMTLQQVADLYEVSTKTLKRKIRKLDLGIDTSSLLYPKDLEKLFDALVEPASRVAQNLRQHEADTANAALKALVIFFALIFTNTLHSQVIYACGEYPPDPIGSLIKIDLATCTFCRVAFQNDPNDFDLALLPNGDVVNASAGNIRVYTPPNQNPTFTVNIMPLVARGNILNPAGTVYMATNQGLGVFNPANNQFTYIGDWPTSFLPIVQMELWYEGGQLYGFFGFPNQQVALINVNNPGNSTIIGPLTWPNFIYNACNIGDTVIMSDYKTIYQYDLTTGDMTTICDFSNTTLAMVGLSSVPNGFPNLPCLCTTNVGTIVPQGLINYCIDETATLTHNNNQILDNNDLLQFVLFSNPSDTAGSIVAVSNTPSFAFDPNTIQTGVTYYMAAMAGDNLNGNVDLDDPCLDFSNANPIVWRPLPTIALSVANPDVCGPEGCTTVTATLSGTPPFSFVYELQIGGNPISNSVTVNSSASMHDFLVCIPPGTPPGQVQLSICTLTDFYCTNE